MLPSGSAWMRGECIQCNGSICAPNTQALFRPLDGNPRDVVWLVGGLLAQCKKRRRHFQNGNGTRTNELQGFTKRVNLIGQ